MGKGGWTVGGKVEVTGEEVGCKRRAFCLRVLPGFEALGVRIIMVYDSKYVIVLYPFHCPLMLFVSDLNSACIWCQVFRFSRLIFVKLLSRLCPPCPSLIYLLFPPTVIR